MERPMTSQEIANMQRLLQTGAQLPADVRQTLGALAIDNQRSRLQALYYSRVKFKGVNKAGTLTFSPALVQAFGFKQGEEIPQSDTTATYADTNIEEAKRTIGHEDVYIWGMTISPDPTTDARLWSLISENTDVSINIGRGFTMHMGSPHIFPSASKATPGHTDTVQPALNASAPAIFVPNSSNGGLRDGIYSFGNKNEWLHWGGEKADALLSVDFNLTRSVEVSMAESRSKQTSDLWSGGTVIDQVAAYDSPFNAEMTDPIYVSVMVHLWGTGINHRGSNT